jgi:hypothetical protein
VDYTRQQPRKQAEYDAWNNEKWIRFANVYLHSNMRMDVGIYIGQDSDVDTLLQGLQTAAEDTVNPAWNQTDPEFHAVLECEDIDDPEDADAVATETLEDAGWTVVRSLAPADKMSKWGTTSFEEAFRLIEPNGEARYSDESVGEGEESDGASDVEMEEGKTGGESEEKVEEGSGDEMDEEE